MSKPAFRLLNLAAFSLLLLALYLNFVQRDADAYTATAHRASPETSLAVSKTNVHVTTISN